jgi:hypothetical protein
MTVKQAQKTKVKEQEVKDDQQTDWQNGGFFGAQGSGSGW